MVGLAFFTAVGTGLLRHVLINIRSVSDADNKNDKFPVFDFIYYSVVSSSYTVGVSALQFFVTCRAGVLFKLVNGPVYFFNFTVRDSSVVMNSC